MKKLTGNSLQLLVGEEKKSGTQKNNAESGGRRIRAGKKALRMGHGGRRAG
jgi:hypothetical protein